jgi:hypothetical protein
MRKRLSTNVWTFNVLKRNLTSSNSRNHAMDNANDLNDLLVITPVKSIADSQVLDVDSFSR